MPVSRQAATGLLCFAAAFRSGAATASNLRGATNTSMCGISSTMWSKPQGNTGACNDCGIDLTKVDPEVVSHWSCGTTDISLNMADMNAQVCSSFTTENQCQFQQKAIKGIQASLVSSGCDGLWVAPLWMVGSVWHLSSTSNVSVNSPRSQHETGEIDIFERGCDLDDGYLLSYGELDQYVENDAWNYAGKPKDDIDITVYLDFRPNGEDKVDSYVCPKGSNPAETGPLDAGCTKTSSKEGYFADTAAQTNDGSEYFWFVSDVWNACPRCPTPGSCPGWGINCGSDAPTSSQCSFAVSGIKMKFNDGYSFKDDAEICNGMKV